MKLNPEINRSRSVDIAIASHVLQKQTGQKRNTHLRAHHHRAHTNQTRATTAATTATTPRRIGKRRFLVLVTDPRSLAEFRRSSAHDRRQEIGRGHPGPQPAEHGLTGHQRLDELRRPTDGDGAAAVPGRRDAQPQRPGRSHGRSAGPAADPSAGQEQVQLLVVDVEDPAGGSFVPAQPGAAPLRPHAGEGVAGAGGAHESRGGASAVDAEAGRRCAEPPVEECHLHAVHAHLFPASGQEDAETAQFPAHFQHSSA